MVKWYQKQKNWTIKWIATILEASFNQREENKREKENTKRKYFIRVNGKMSTIWEHMDVPHKEWNKNLMSYNCFFTL